MNKREIFEMKGDRAALYKIDDAREENQDVSDGYRANFEGL